MQDEQEPNDAGSELRTTQVDLSALMRVLGDHLYSSPTVAVRELVQNAHDSITRRRLENPGAPPGEIVVVPDGAAGTLTLVDNGAGLTREEVIAYLATVGAGYTRKLRQEHTDAQDLIGMFGLGFLTAFVVGARVTVHTTSSSNPHAGLVYQARSAERYSLREAPARPVGTSVELLLKERFRSLADPEVLEPVLRRYCALLPIPVRLGTHGPCVNEERPPWSVPEDDATVARRTRLDFAERFETEFEPLGVMDVEPTPDLEVQGLLWVQGGTSYGSADNRKLSVFVRGMLLGDDVRDLLPRWAGFISGVITSPALTPTASREDLQRDDAWEAAAVAIHRSLLSGLKRLARTEPEAWRRILARHNEALLGAAVADDGLMELLRDELTVPTSEGDLPVKTVLRRSNQRAYVTLASHGGFEEMLFRALKVPVVSGTRFGALAFVRAYPGAQVVMLGTSEGDRHVFAAAPLPEADRAFLQAHLVPAHAELVLARFKPASLPLVLVPDRDAELKRRLDEDAASRRISQAALGLARLFTAQVQGPQARLYVNVDNPAVQALLGCRTSGRDPVPAARLLRALASLMSGGGESGAQVDLSSTLEDYTAAVVAMLGGG